MLSSHSFSHLFDVVIAVLKFSVRRSSVVLLLFFSCSSEDD